MKVIEKKVLSTLVRELNRAQEGYGSLFLEKYNPEGFSSVLSNIYHNHGCITYYLLYRLIDNRRVIDWDATRTRIHMAKAANKFNSLGGTEVKATLAIKYNIPKES